MRKRRLIFATLTIFLASFFITAAGARGDVFVIEPAQEVTENVELDVSSDVAGNFSVKNGFIEFYVTDPSGIVILCYNKTAFNTFSFAAGENGIFTMHLVNTYQTEKVNVTLNYGINFCVVIQEKVNADFSLGTARVVPPPTLPPSPEDSPNLDNPYEKYLNFVSARFVLRILRDVWKYMPLQNTVLILGCTLLVTALIEISKRAYLKSSKHSLTNEPYGL